MLIERAYDPSQSLRRKKKKIVFVLVVVGVVACLDHHLKNR